MLAAAVALALAAAPAAHADASGAVGGVRNPAAGVLELTVLASESTGVGLRSARALLVGRTFDVEFFGDPDCAAGACPATGRVDLTVPTEAVPDGARRLEVLVTDAAGSEVHLLDQTITVANAPIPRQSTVTVTIGSGTASPPPATGPAADPPPPPAQAAGCRAPRLTMALAQEPLRLRRGDPVLARGRKYRFRGRLTCRVDGRRRPAPRGTLVGVHHRVRGRTVRKRPLRVGRRGRIVARLEFRSSRALVFRVRGAGGDVVRVRIAIRVVRP